MKQVKYNHPAHTKVYDVNKVYALDVLKETLSLEEIKTLFTPIDFEWEDLEPENIKSVEINKIKSKTKTKEVLN